MTGFGRGTSHSDKFLANVELSSVNRKQAEIVVQSPRTLLELEPRIRTAVLETTSRGRVQVTVRLDQANAAAVPVKLDPWLARGLEAAFVELSETLGRKIEPDASDFLRTPGVISIEEPEVDIEAAWNVIDLALTEALAQFNLMRHEEGRDLGKDLITRLEALRQTTQSIAETAPLRAPRNREALDRRLREAGLTLELSDDRVVRELALFADRCDITEELTRLDSHFRKFEEYLRGGEPAGRALDFLCQEIHREFNTIGSKANDAAIAQHVVEAKTELEKMREQVQNVE